MSNKVEEAIDALVSDKPILEGINAQQMRQYIVGGFIGTPDLPDQLLTMLEKELHAAGYAIYSADQYDEKDDVSVMIYDTKPDTRNPVEEIVNRVIPSKYTESEYQDKSDWPNQP